MQDPADVNTCSVLVMPDGSDVMPDYVDVMPGYVDVVKGQMDVSRMTST